MGTTIKKKRPAGAAPEFTIKDKPEFMKLIEKLREFFPQGTKFTNASVKELYTSLQNDIKKFKEKGSLDNFIDSVLSDGSYSIVATNGTVIELDSPFTEVDSLPGNCGVAVGYGIAEVDNFAASITVIMWILEQVNAKNPNSYKGILMFSNVVGHVSVSDETLGKIGFMGENTLTVIDSLNTNTDNIIRVVCISMPKTVGLEDDEIDQFEDDGDLAEDEIDPDEV